MLVKRWHRPAGAGAALDHDEFLRVLDVNLAGAFNAALVLGAAIVAAGWRAIVSVAPS